jgi:hypothetical protein
MIGRQASAGEAQYVQFRSAARTRATCAEYARYRAEKDAWVSRNPEATPEQYQTAMRAISKACGI